MITQTLCVAFFQIGTYFLTDYFFPSSLFSVFRDCYGKFDNFAPFPEDGMIGYEEEEEGEEEEGGEEGGEEEEGDPEFKATEEEDEDIYYQECIDNSTNFYISFSQYLILAVVFCTGRPFKKNIFHNYGMFIFSIIGFIYAEYIVFYVDYFSRKWIYISAYPDDPFVNYYILKEEQKNTFATPFKYYIMGIIVINFIACLIIEKMILPSCYKCWRRRKMDKLREELKLNGENEATLKLINNVKNYIREQQKNKKVVDDEVQMKKEPEIEMEIK